MSEIFSSAARNKIHAKVPDKIIFKVNEKEAKGTPYKCNTNPLTMIVPIIQKPVNPFAANQLTGFYVLGI